MEFLTLDPQALNIITGELCLAVKLLHNMIIFLQNTHKEILGSSERVWYGVSFVSS